MKRRDDRHRSTTTGAGRGLRLLSVITAIAIAACSSTSTTGEPATLVYVGSSDDTWTAIHIVLVDLDYDVEQENRDEGTIRAIRSASENRPRSVLTVDQVARTETISLYVRAAAAPGDPPMDETRRRQLAEEFLAPVKELLY
jgi:hypothetical protein